MLPNLTILIIDSNNQKQTVLFSFKLAIILAGQGYPINNLPLALYLTLKKLK